VCTVAAPLEDAEVIRLGSCHLKLLKKELLKNLLGEPLTGARRVL
jgi:hypothetical protein